jgi:hypothetical protein
MPRLQEAREAVAGVFRYRLLWVVQFVANLVLFGLFAAWLLLPVANAWQLALNALLASVIVVAVVAVHAGTMNYFSDTNRLGNPKLADALQRAMRHIAAIAVCAAVFYLLWNLIDKAEFYESQFPAYIRSISPASIRRHLSLGFFETIFQETVFTARWLIVPGLILPFLVRTADLGFDGFGTSGFSAWRKTISSASYWLVLVSAVLVGVLATQKIMNWTPDFRTSTLGHESFSLALRLPFAYLLGLFAWMMTCSLLGRMGSGRRDAG